ncbi:ribonuclease Z [Candidatus Daviesbacteria bacterium]|nr:ribonuclease Z [Candidatus Daviesbacteria bacterium]
MKIIFLGTNGWYTTQTGNTACILIDSKDYYVIFDGGNGIYKLDQHIKETKPIYLFISHFHLDHVEGLHVLNKFTFAQGINICLPEGRKQDFDKLVTPPFTTPTNKYKMKVNFCEDLPFPVEIIELFHAYKDHGFRITLDGKIIAYSGDAGISKASYKLAENADLLIHESSYLLDHPKSSWGHVGPDEAATLAKETGVNKLVLTHFDASLYTSLKQRGEAEKAAQSIFPNTICATDDLVITL